MSAKATHWGYTLNNYTESDLVLVRNATTIDPIVEHVYTLEKGESGTPHVQGYLKCSRQVRLTHLKKHWLPQAHFQALNNDEYRANMRDYVQKQDHTAASGTHQRRRIEPVLYPALIPELLVQWISDNLEDHHNPPSYDTTWFWVRNLTEHQKAQLEEIAHQQPKATLTLNDEWRWKGAKEPVLLATHEAPLELVVELAKRELVQTHRVETLVDRPEVTKAVRSYYHQILARMKHNADVTDEEAHVSEAEDDVQVQTYDTASDSTDDSG